MKVRELSKLIVMAGVLCLAVVFSCSSRSTNERLMVFHAGSLSVPFRKIAADFEKENPGVKVMLESAGSRTCARKISDLGRECDVMASADYTVIDELLIPGHASWNIRFAGNEMTIVYHRESKRSEEINDANWFEILLDEGVAFGRSDPDSDPCGYRAVLTAKLAETHYGHPGLAEKILIKDNRYIRPKETDLLALLETGTIDYIFLYRSVAEQHGLDFLVLPDRINLKSTEHIDFYETATVEISGKQPGETITKHGAPMVYGLTIPSGASRPRIAQKFVEFVLDPAKGGIVLQESGQPTLVPAQSTTYDRIPEQLKRYAEPI